MFGLRTRLLLLLATMLLPFVVFSVYKAWDINHRLTLDAQREGLLIAQGVGDSIDDYMVSTTEILGAIAKDERVQARDYAYTDAWLQRILPDYPHYSNIIYVDTVGDIRAAGLHPKDQTGVINVAETAYFKRSMETTGVALGDFMYGKISGRPVVHVCYPVYDKAGTRIGFVAAAMHLTRVQDRLMRESGKDYVTIAVIDRSGIMIAHNREAERYVGKDVTETFRVEKMRAEGEGLDRLRFPDGVEKVCAFTDVDSAPWFVRVGVDLAYIRGQVASELTMHFAVFVPLLLVAFAGWLWIGRDVDRLHKETERMSLVDSLTQTWNVRKLTADLKRSVEHARRSSEPVSFAMVDLDDFKVFNDAFGHQVGDEALKTLVGVISYALRETDTVYRYGGEEFCLLLPVADCEGAAVVAERVRQAVAATRFRVGGEGRTERLSVSIGLACFPADGDSPEALIRAADAALYQAKDRGKDRVVIYAADMKSSGREPAPHEPALVEC